MENWQNWAQAYRPIVYLDKREKYFPTTIDHYLSNCIMFTPNNGILPTIINRYNLANLGNQFGPETFLWCDNKIGLPDNLPSVPFLTHIRLQGEWVAITYIFVYAYNGPLNKCGAHQADIEHATFLFNHQGHLQHIYLAAHDRYQGRWMKPQDLDWEDGHPIIYSALHSHGSYARPQTTWRLFGCFNDHTSQGKKWLPEELEFINENTEWLHYCGFLGGPSSFTFYALDFQKGHVKTPLYQSWWHTESKYTVKWYNRMFGCILPHWGNKKVIF